MNNFDLKGGARRQDRAAILDHRSDRPIRLIFVARKFANMAGGLERISIDLMNEMVRRGYRVNLMTWDSSDAISHYPIDAQIDWLKLDIGNAEESSNFEERLARLKRFRNFVRNFDPDVILGFQSGAALFARVATLGLGIPIIAAERVSPDMWRYVRRRLINRITDIYSLLLADCITVQFPDYKQKYPKFLQKKIVAIHNPVFYKAGKCLDQKHKSEKILLYVARLCFQKNHGLLLEAFARTSDIHQDWKLVLVGDGDYDSLLREEVARKGLEGRVEFCGAVVDVDAWYRVADLVAFPSLYEGFPNALAEALSWGIPCVGLKDTLGVNTLIQDSVNGLLVEADPDAFAQALSVLMDTPLLRERMSTAAIQISYRYAPHRSYDLWESLFRQLMLC